MPPAAPAATVAEPLIKATVAAAPAIAWSTRSAAKGHAVARHSQHMEGNAVDFRIRGVATKNVLHYVRSLHAGGVGFYPHSQFVHTDTGRVRYWHGS